MELLYAAPCVLFVFMDTFLFIAQGGEGLGDLARSVGEKFGFHWVLFISQMLSFCMVVALLQRFAYKPILKVLEERRQRIAEGLANAERIKAQLAESEQRYQEILAKANAEAQKMIDEARTSAAALSERRQQQAIAEAEQIIAKAREQTVLEHDRMMADLKKEFGRLVLTTTSKVTGKVLTPADQKRLAEETANELAV
jgi:F-type H+-transporting ATPase subunit b